LLTTWGLRKKSSTLQFARFVNKVDFKYYTLITRCIVIPLLNDVLIVFTKCVTTIEASYKPSFKIKDSVFVTGNIRPTIEDILTAIDIQREIENQKQELTQQTTGANITPGKHN